MNTPEHPSTGARGDVEGLVRVPSPDETAYTEALTQIAILQHQAADLQTELETLKLVLGRFEAEYHTKVGYLFVTLDRVRLAHAQMRRRITGRDTSDDTVPEAIEDQIQQEFASHRERIDAADAESRRYQRAHDAEKDQPQLSESDQRELKRLYRDLARRYHPDLARSDADRSQREVRMLAINAAFRDRNLSALTAITAASEHEDPAFDRRPLAERLQWVQRERSRLAEVLVRLHETYELMRSTDTFGLWQRCQTDSTLLDRLAQDVQGEIGATQRSLDQVTVAYHDGERERSRTSSGW